MDNSEQGHAADATDATVIRGGLLADVLRARGRFEAVCIGPDGREKWRDTVENLVVNVGKDLMLDTMLAGSAYTASIFMGLKAAGTPAAGDTQASHSTWNEVGNANAPTYSGTRKTPTWSAASAGSKATSAASSFSMTGSGTVTGCFLNEGGTSAIDNTTGTLFSAGDFTGGSKTVSSGDTINVSYTLSI